MVVVFYLSCLRRYLCSRRKTACDEASTTHEEKLLDVNNFPAPSRSDLVVYFVNADDLVVGFGRELGGKAVGIAACGRSRIYGDDHWKPKTSSSGRGKREITMHACLAITRRVSPLQLADTVCVRSLRPRERSSTRR